MTGTDLIVRTELAAMRSALPAAASALRLDDGHGRARLRDSLEGHLSASNGRVARRLEERRSMPWAVALRPASISVIVTLAPTHAR